MSVAVEKMLVTSGGKSVVIPICPVTPETWARRSSYPGNFTVGLAESQKFEGKPGQILIIPGNGGAPSAVCIGVKSLILDDMWEFSKAAKTLPDGTYRIDDFGMPMDENQAYKAAIGWALARYKFKIKKGELNSDPGEGPKLVVPAKIQSKFNEIEQEVKATWKTRDLINMPANILNTEELALEVLDLANEFNAVSDCVEGLMLAKKFPLIHAVGKASENRPFLTHFSWEGTNITKDSPTILLVGKGITFDSGGLQIKPGDSMATMKKDMGGAAITLGLARMIMANDLPVKLNVAIPIAENSVSKSAYRPSDVIAARDGTEVEIGHTDAEGRLILADALSFGVEHCNPNLIIDFATLTGAQRVADGVGVGGVVSNSKKLGRTMEDMGERWSDNLQYHHMFEEHREFLKSKNGGEITNSSAGPGTTMAAMFLQHFIRAANPGTPWFHFDVSGSNAAAKPGRPLGGEAMSMRAAYRYIKDEYVKKMGL